MLTIVILSVAVPAVAGMAYLTLRHRPSRAAADSRGIALQTVIVMVVLLAVAGAVAGVLLTRGGEAVEEVERQQIVRSASDYSIESLCTSAGFSWDTSGPVCR